MGWNQIAAVASGAIALVGAICTAWQIYQMTVSDAKARGLKHPKFWGFWAMNGNNSSGLILYLIGRRKYPVQNMSIEDQEKIETRKKACLLYTSLLTTAVLHATLNHCKLLLSFLHILAHCTRHLSHICLCYSSNSQLTVLYSLFDTNLKEIGWNLVLRTLQAFFLFLLPLILWLKK